MCGLPCDRNGPLLSAAGSCVPSYHTAAPKRRVPTWRQPACTDASIVGGESFRAIARSDRVSHATIRRLVGEGAHLSAEYARPEPERCGSGLRRTRSWHSRVECQRLHLGDREWDGAVDVKDVP